MLWKSSLPPTGPGPLLRPCFPDRCDVEDDEEWRVVIRYRWKRSVPAERGIGFGMERFR